MRTIAADLYRNDGAQYSARTVNVVSYFIRQRHFDIINHAVDIKCDIGSHKVHSKHQRQAYCS